MILSYWCQSFYSTFDDDFDEDNSIDDVDFVMDWYVDRRDKLNAIAQF